MFTNSVPSFLRLAAIGLVLTALTGCPRENTQTPAPRPMADPPAPRHGGQVVRIPDTRTADESDTLAYAEFLIERDPVKVTAHLTDAKGKPYPLPVKTMGLSLFHTIRELPTGVQRQGYAIRLEAEGQAGGKASKFVGGPNPDFADVAEGVQRLLRERSPLECGLVLDIDGDQLEIGLLHFHLDNPGAAKKEGMP